MAASSSKIQGWTEREVVRRHAVGVAAPRRVEPPLGVRRAALHGVNPPAQCGDGGVVLKCGASSEPCEPGFDPLAAPVVVDGERDRGQDPRGPLDVAGRLGMVERALEVAAGLEPVGRSLVEHGDELGLVLLELSAEHVAEESVVAVVAALRVDADEEEVRPLDRVELDRGTPAVEDRVAERSRQLLEHRAASHEGEPLGREACEVLGVEVLRDAAVFAGEGCGRPASAGRPERAGCKVKPHRPALAPDE